MHAVAHSLGGKYNVPHGLANAVILPYVLERYGEKAEKKLAKLADAAGISGSSTHDKARAFIDAIKAMEREMMIPEKLDCIRRSDIPELARTADREANPLYPVPVLMDAAELEAIYCDVMAEAVGRKATTA